MLHANCMLADDENGWRLEGLEGERGYRHVTRSFMGWAKMETESS